MNRRLPVIPPSKPFMMPKAIYDYLKSVQDLTKETPSSAVQNDKELMTVAEVQQIIEKKNVSIHMLQPRTMENGTPFIYPRYKNKKKPPETSYSISDYSKPKNKIRGRLSTFLHSEQNKRDIIKTESTAKETPISSSLYKLESNLAKQVLEITKKRSKFFQNLAFSSAFLSKVIEKDKNVNFLIPPEFQTPLIEQKDISDFPSTIHTYCRPYFKQKSAELKEAYQLLSENN